MITKIAHQIAALPFVYDLIQRAVGCGPIFKILQPHLAATSASTLLDLGAGTANFRPLAPPSAKYIWFDSDPVKLAGYRAKFHSGSSLLGNGGQLRFREQSIDFALFAAVSHHLNDEEFNSTLAALTKILRHRLICFDAFKSEDGLSSNLLWCLDRGCYPRSRDSLIDFVSRYFDIESVEDLSTYHRYVLIVANSSARK